MYICFYLCNYYILDSNKPILRISCNYFSFVTGFGPSFNIFLWAWLKGENCFVSEFFLDTLLNPNNLL